MKREKKHAGRPYDNRIYAAYLGDTNIMDGTLDEISRSTGRKRSELQRLLTPSMKRKIERCLDNCEKARKKSRILSLVLIDGVDDE